jgi:hypothetical protein
MKMKYATIRIEGPILTTDILDKIAREDIAGQSSRDFNLPSSAKVKDEIARAWADAQDIWRVFQRRLLRLPETEYGTTETRKFWMIPLLEMLGYDTEYARAETVNGKTYAISHRAKNLDRFPIHIMGFRDSLDKKRSDSGPRMSPHGLVQEYLNLTEHLYAIVSNGAALRLLRDSSRLIKLSFVEFDIAAMMNDGHFADFAILYRLIHASRMPRTQDQSADSLIEQYHQDALESGARIRNGLSTAVEKSLKCFGTGFLMHPDNHELQKKLETGELDEKTFFQYLLKLIYRLLFLMVIEERDQVFPSGGVRKDNRQIYYDFYSVSSLRRLSEKPWLADHRFKDLWISLKNCFALFEQGKPGEKLGIRPLAGDLFSIHAIGVLNRCCLDNRTLITCLGLLNMFEHPVTGQKIRINYGALNVEEFGSVYEGLLEKDPVIFQGQDHFLFSFKKGQQRSSSGSHYTPDELVQPLIKHSLDHIIADKLKSPDPVAALLAIKVCDVACGSGHILLNAARRIGAEIARLRSGEEQPSPEPFRQGVRDVIRHCIFGVDKNPLAVELCKVALWLEAHIPGEPLTFLDHRIKCGDAVVGLARKEELENGIVDQAFNRMPDDDKDVRADLAKQNKRERKNAATHSFVYDRAEFEKIQNSVLNVSELVKTFNAMPETTPDQVEDKKNRYRKMISGQVWQHLKKLADIQTAQFFIPKTEENFTRIITDSEFRKYLSGKAETYSPATELATAVAAEKRFFHWFLEFPVVFAQGGFDCILGNPPYLGGQALSGTFGNAFLNWVKTAYAPAGSCDLVTYFLRRIFQIIRPHGFNAILSTNSISEGATREGGLEIIIKSGGSLNFVQKSVRWPGVANLYVSLFSIYKGTWQKKRFLDNQPVDYISSHFEDYKDLGPPRSLKQNEKQMFQGSIFLGDGFLLNDTEKAAMIDADPKNSEVIFPLINGRDVNDSYHQKPKRHIINFFNWDQEKARTYKAPFRRVEELVKPVRFAQKDIGAKECWWLHIRPRLDLYTLLKNYSQCFIVARTTKFLNFTATITTIIYSDALFVYANDNFFNFAIVQSTLHNEWARKYSSSLETRLRYTPINCFETFPFPQNPSPDIQKSLRTIGRQYHDFRKQLMYRLQLGLTKTYNLFHAPDLSIDMVKTACHRDEESAKQAYEALLHLRELHKAMDQAVRDAYGWRDIDLAHGFYPMDYLPENDRIRYTMSPESRKEILNRLLALNHACFAEEVAMGLHDKKKGATKRTKKVERKKAENAQLDLFG